MHLPIILTTANFGESVKGWTRERFLDTFRPVYPESNLENVASELGLKKAAKETRPKLQEGDTVSE